MSEGDTASADKSIDDVMAEVAEEISHTGVGKEGKNEKQGWKFRKLDDILDCVGPIMARHKLAMTVEFGEHQSEWRSTRAGGDMEFVTVAGEFVYRYRGQTRLTRTIGKAMDSSDKATNKAMAFATKYAHINTFNIPVVGSDDADAYSVEGTKAAAPPPQPEQSEMSQARIAEFLEEFALAPDIKQLTSIFQTAATVATKKHNDVKAFETLKAAAGARKRELLAKQQATPESMKPILDGLDIIREGGPR